jgi:hypothetical protein
MEAKAESNIDLTSFFNTLTIAQTKIISDYEGEKIPDLSEEHLLICGDIIDSTVGGGGDSTKIPDDGSVGGISKNYNLYNIHKVLTDDKIRLILGNRDFNKIKCLPLCKMKYTNTQTIPSDKQDITNFNNGNLNLSIVTYNKYLPLLKKNDWMANMNNWLPFWNDGVMIINTKKGDHYDIWREKYSVTTSKTPFFDRFKKIFGVDGSIGTMSAGNLLYTIPFEVLGVDKIDVETRKNEDYLAFIVLSVFNAGFNKNEKQYKKKDYKFITSETNLHNTYINGLFYRFYKLIGTKKVNFMGYANLADKFDKFDKLYVFSHGGITSDLIDNPSLEDLQTQIITDYEKITNSKKAIDQQGGAIDVEKSFTKEHIILSLKQYNENVCNIVKTFMDNFYKCINDLEFTNLSNTTHMPSRDMLLLLTVGAPYKPVKENNDRDLKFVMRSPINPGIGEIIKNKKGFVCDNAVLTQIFGHIPKGFGPTFFTLQNGDKKSYLANIDMSQSFKYSGWAGKSNVNIIFNRNINQFTLHYVLDFSNKDKIKNSDKTELIQIYTKDTKGTINNEDNGKYILINTTDEPPNKTLIITQRLDNIFENEEKIKIELKDKIGENVILYHGFNDENKLHIFSLSDSMSSHNKVLVLYNSTKNNSTESQAGGYYEKYMKYKTKYLALKNSM